MAVKKNINLVWNYFKINLASALEYRTNFIIGIVGMVLNDAVWLFFWFIIMGKFGDINGWGLQQILQLFAFITITWGLSGTFFGNRGQIGREVENGALDFFLSFPESPLVHLLTSRLKLGAVGDLIFGIIIAFFCINFADIPLFIILILFGTIITIAYTIIVGTLSFFFGASTAIEKNLVMGLVTFGMYPISIFGGVAKIILLTLIPAGLIVGVPVELLSLFNLKWFLIIGAAAIGMLFLSVKFFYYGLKRYESGNMIIARM